MSGAIQLSPELAIDWSDGSGDFAAGLLLLGGKDARPLALIDCEGADELARWTRTSDALLDLTSHELDSDPVVFVVAADLGWYVITKWGAMQVAVEWEALAAFLAAHGCGE